MSAGKNGSAAIFEFEKIDHEGRSMTFVVYLFFPPTKARARMGKNARVRN